MKIFHIFFHSADFDGYCSAMEVYYYAISKFSTYKIKFVPINYGAKLNKKNIGKNDIVFMVDFSLPSEDMIWLKNNTFDFIWIDHHKSAIDASINNSYSDINGIRKNGIGACKLVYDFINPLWKDYLNKYPIELLANYDVWNHVDNVLEFQYGLRLYDMFPRFNHDIWKNILLNNNIQFIEKIINDGKIILKYETLQNSISSKTQSYIKEFEGYTCLLINDRNSSKVFDDVYDVNKIDFMITYYYSPKYKNWKVSIYTEHPLLDASIIAKKYGGGGHPGASGFTLDDINILLE